MGDADVESVSAVASRCAARRAVSRMRAGAGGENGTGKIQKRREISAVLMMSKPIVSVFLDKNRRSAHLSGRSQSR
eukprot:COSAG01_NODE_7065_length_3369_cov_10.052905_6_plen_76_part_00